jgi:hypothetical protein
MPSSLKSNPTETRFVVLRCGVDPEECREISPLSSGFSLRHIDKNPV